MIDQEVKEWIEEELRYYPLLKSKIKIKKNQIAAEEDYASKAVDYSQIPGGKTNNISSEVESFIQSKLDKYPEVYELILEKEKIESALNCLTWRQYKLVELKYFQDFSDKEIVFRMIENEKKMFRNSKGKIMEDYREYSIPTVQRMKLEVLNKLKKVGFCEIEKEMSRK